MADTTPIVQVNLNMNDRQLAAAVVPQQASLVTSLLSPAAAAPGSSSASPIGFDEKAGLLYGCKPDLLIDQLRLLAESDLGPKQKPYPKLVLLLLLLLLLFVRFCVINTYTMICVEHTNGFLSKIRLRKAKH